MKYRRLLWFFGVAVIIVAAVVAGLALSRSVVWGTVTPRWIARHMTGVAGMDAHKADFSQLSASEIALLTYDTKTKWPDQNRFPAGFDPNAILQQSITPGLGLDSLHQQGITGKGVNVAVIDKYILPEHQEFSGRIEYTKIFPDKTRGTDPQFHGMAAASILAGTRVGVAPGAFLYYFAIPDDRRGFDNYVDALAEILKLNPTLPAEKRIRIVSVSWSPTTETNRAQWAKLVDQALTQGIAVLTSGGPPELEYTCTGALPGRNRDDLNAYEWSPWVLRNSNGQVPGDLFGVPADYRTTASVEGPDAYIHWGEGGKSWAIPYVGGLLALSLQVRPDASFPDLYRTLKETTTVNAQGVPMVHPAAYIEALRKSRS